MVQRPRVFNHVGFFCCRWCGTAATTQGPAIKLGKGHLYVARLATRGYASALAAAAAPGGDAAGPNVAEYSAHGAETLGDGAPKAGLLLKPPREPAVPFPSKPED